MMIRCSQSDKPIVTVPNVVPQVHVYGRQSGTTRFFLSDNPETISSATTSFTNGFATLWHDSVRGRKRVQYRLFVWHLNKTGAPITFGVTVENASCGRPIRVRQVKHSIGVIADFPALGRCSAKALLGRTLAPLIPGDRSIRGGQTGLVKEWLVPDGELVGGVMEFTLSSPKELDYRVRTVAANRPGADVRLNHTPVVPAYRTPEGKSHPRGSWDFADIEGFADPACSQPVTYVAGSGSMNFAIHNGGNDNLMTAAASYDPANAEVANKGHYGVIYKLNLALCNPHPRRKTVTVYLTGRGGPYAGAVRWNRGRTYGVPRLSPAVEAVEAATVTIPARRTVACAVYASTAGAYSTPAAVLCVTRE
ncbi:hypothetical protein ABEX25_01995 [Paenibacillus thiaminolyticus]|uniref:hypothetical protein n=1 Tax=Paenibacillus thiaminolyticus TaxID=49283 RepID=UPI003D288F01